MVYPKINIPRRIINICSEEDLEYLPIPSGEVVDGFLEQDIVIHQEDSYD